jgi:hypothetical protein
MSSRSRMRERDLLLFVFNKEQQMLRWAQHDRYPFSAVRYTSLRSEFGYMASLADSQIAAQTFDEREPLSC